MPDWLGTPPGPIRDRGVSKPVIESSKPLGTLVRELSPPRSTSVGMGSLSLTKVPPPGSPGPPEGESGRSPGVRDSFAGGRHRRHHPDRFGRAPLRTQSVGPARARGGHAFSSCLTLQGPIGPESGVTSWGARQREASHTHRLRTVSRVRGRSRPPSVSREREGSCYPHERTIRGRQRHI